LSKVALLAVRGNAKSGAAMEGMQPTDESNRRKIDDTTAKGSWARARN
jgi:hypothetical protein